MELRCGKKLCKVWVGTFPVANLFPECYSHIQVLLPSKGDSSNCPGTLVSDVLHNLQERWSANSRWYPPPELISEEHWWAFFQCFMKQRQFVRFSHRLPSAAPALEQGQLVSRWDSELTLSGVKVWRWVWAQLQEQAESLHKIWKNQW